MIKKQLNKNTKITIQNFTTEIFTQINNKYWKTVIANNKKSFYTNVCEHCDDMHDVKYMNEADACLCFNCREAVGLEIIADEQWEDTKRSLMGVI